MTADRFEEKALEVRHRFWSSRSALEEKNIIAAALREAEADGLRLAAEIYASARDWDYFGTAHEAILSQAKELGDGPRPTGEGK